LLESRDGEQRVIITKTATNPKTATIATNTGTTPKKFE
jgi:hypothetical protein